MLELKPDELRKGYGDLLRRTERGTLTVSAKADTLLIEVALVDKVHLSKGDSYKVKSNGKYLIVRKPSIKALQRVEYQIWLSAPCVILPFLPGKSA